jgi:pilus assembly protein CpaE
MLDSAEESIRVLIVDDIAETRENIRKLLQFEPDISVVGAARSGEEALELARETKPDVVIMDINMPDMDGITATEKLLLDVPYAQIIILSVQSEPDYMRRAMLAGARDFIAKPPSGDELIQTIRSLAERAREQRAKLERPVPQVAAPGVGAGFPHPTGKVIAVYSAKGGVGCTMLATNLALGLQTRETQVVLIDAALQFGDVAVSLNLQAKNSIVDLASRVEEIDPEVVEDVLLQHESGLRVLAAPPRPELADEVKAEQVRGVLQHLRQNYAYVIVDTSSTMDDITLAVLDTADLLVTMTTPEIPAIKDARLLFDLLGVLDLPSERVFFVLNKVDRKSGITAAAIAENLNHPIDGSIPLDERTVSTSVNRGVPLLLAEKGSTPAKSIIDLLGTIRQRLVDQDEEEE